VPPNKIKDKRIVFNLVRSYAMGPLFMESTLAMKLREYGAKVNVVIDDNILRHHDTLQYKDFVQSNSLKFLKINICNNFLKRISLYKKYSEFINQKELENISSMAESLIKRKNYFYKNIDLKPYIDASVIRFYQSAAGFAEKESNYNKIERIFTVNAILSALIASKVEGFLHPDIIITSHGIYSTWGPFYEYFKQKNKKVITYDFSTYANNAVNFSKNGLVVNRYDDGFFNEYKNKIDITVSEKSIKDIFNKRFKAKSDDLTLYGNLIEDNNFLRKIKDIACRKQVFLLLPNVLWDQSIIGVNNIFNSPKEWITETIKFFEKEEDKLLVIREHPAGASIMKSRIGIREILISEFGKDARNIKNLLFIPSNNFINSYSLFPIIKAGIVYNGTMGLEMMYKKIPVLIAGNAPYSFKGFTMDFKTKEEYFQIFNKLEKMLEFQEKNRNILIKFLFFNFVLNEIPLSFFSNEKRWTPKLDMTPTSIFRDKNFKYIAETILEKHNFFQEWYWNEG
jgi:hypothetical protein